VLTDAKPNGEGYRSSGNHDDKKWDAHRAPSTSTFRVNFLRSGEPSCEIPNGCLARCRSIPTFSSATELETRKLPALLQISVKAGVIR
jgi:hypothetical protein